MDAATISDAVNTASRVESLTKHYGASILLTEDSLNKIEDRIEFNLRYLGKVRVKGKKEPVGIYECYDGDAPQMIRHKLSSLSDFEKGLEYYFARDFAVASAAFDRVVKDNPDKLFLNKSAHYIHERVPEEWTGVELMTFK